MLFHESPKVVGVDASFDYGLFKTNVLEHVWDLVLLRYYEVIGVLGQKLEND